MRRNVPLPLISMDDDKPRAARRLKKVQRDVALHATGRPCPGCKATARLSGGEGCTCPEPGESLTDRCIRLADKAAGRGGPQ